MSTKIKVLSFDLDDTLWPCEPTINRAESVLFQWLTDNVPSIPERYNVQQLREKRRQLFLDEAELSHDLSALRLRSFHLLAEELSLETDWIARAFDVFYQARQDVTLFADVEPVLDALSGKFQLASLTNGNADAGLTGIDKWFRYSLNSALVGKKKSEPDIYWKLQAMAAVQPEQMLHIGDDPVHDISGAKSSGALAVWLNRDDRHWPDIDCDPDAEISSLHELPEVISQLERRV